VCWSKSPGPNEEVVRIIKNSGGRAYAYSVDVSDRAEVEKAAAKVRAEVGDVTIVINNAGRMSVLPFLETPPSEIESLFKVNVLSNFWVLREFLPNMIERKRGHVVSVCSASGILPIRCIAAYASTKHAVQGYMDALQDEILHHPAKPNIKFTTAYPFYCKTEMLDEGVPHTRFPFLFPIVTPQMIAKKLVYGIRREYEYLYIPPLIGWLAMFSWLVTPKAVIAHREFLQLHIDPVEKKEI
jgi:all-trans-retinol dehydrogenase (NAD+)